MKINDELLFFIIKSRLFAHLAFFLPPSVKGGASLFFWLSEQAGCALTHPRSLILPDQHPFVASSTCLLLGVEISCSSNLNCCRVLTQNDMTPEGISVFFYGSAELFCPHHPSSGPGPALHGCAGRFRLRWWVRSLVLSGHPQALSDSSINKKEGELSRQLSI